MCPTPSEPCVARPFGRTNIRMKESKIPLFGDISDSQSSQSGSCAILTPNPLVLHNSFLLASYMDSYEEASVMTIRREVIEHVDLPKVRPCSCSKCVVRIPLSYGWALYCVTDVVTFLGVEAYP